MITAVSFIVLVFIITAFYVFNYKDAEITISFVKGLVVGFSLASPEIDDCKTNFFDLYLGFIIISLVWDD